MFVRIYPSSTQATYNQPVTTRSAPGAGSHDTAGLLWAQPNPALQAILAHHPLHPLHDGLPTMAQRVRDVPGRYTLRTPG